MADKKPIARILIDGSNEAFAVSKRSAGDADSSAAAVPALVGKDASGNLQYLRTKTDGTIFISGDQSDFACLTANGLVAGSIASFQLVATITLQASKTYKLPGWVIGATRISEFKLVWGDDVGGGGEAFTDLVQGLLVGSGDDSDSDQIECIEFTTGATGTQQLRLEGINLVNTTDLRGTIAVKEVQ